MFLTANPIKRPATNVSEIPTTPAAKTISISAEEASIPEECIRLSTLQDIFHKAEFLLNTPGSITQAASNDIRVRTVTRRSGDVPLIVKPLKKGSNLFNCQCNTFKGLGICADTIAVAESQSLLFEYLTELRRKLCKNRAKPRSKGRGDVNITAAMETGLKISETGKVFQNTNQLTINTLNLNHCMLPICYFLILYLQVSSQTMRKR